MVLLALSDELPEVVEPYLRKLALPFPVAAGSTARQRYGVRAIPHSVLIDAGGRIVWRGHPSQLAEKQIRDVLASVDATTREGSVVVEGELAGRAAEIGALAKQGELARALERCASLQADASASQAEREGAARVREAIAARVARWVERAREQAAAGEPLAAAHTLKRALAAVGESELGAPARAALSKLREDTGLARELDAEALLEAALELAARRGPQRARGKLEQVVRDFPGTRAADRAHALLQAN